MKNRLLYGFVAALGLFTMFGAPASAKTMYSVPDDVIVLDILPGWRTADGTHMAAIRIRLEPGWKTYWRAPGDGGIPPQFDWSGSRNISAARLIWPRPDVIEQNGVRTIGYSNEVVLPVELTPRSAGKGMALKGKVDLGVCKDICMPMTMSFSAELPADEHAPAGAIVAALADRPIAASQAGVSAVRCDVQPISDGVRLTAAITLPKISKDEVVVIETADQGVWVSQAATRRDGPVLTATSDLVPPSNAPFVLDRSGVRITVLGGARAVDIRGCNGG